MAQTPKSVNVEAHLDEQTIDDIFLGRLLRRMMRGGFDLGWDSSAGHYLRLDEPFIRLETVEVAVVNKVANDG